MDVFSHGLWSGAIFKGINLKKKKLLSVKWAIFWGIFPDFFAFASLFVWLFWGMIFGDLSFGDFPRPEQTEPISPDTFFIFQLTSFLYSATHSLPVFFLIIVSVLFLNRFVIPTSLKLNRIPWEMGAWLFHILIDIPTHTYKFYPTPFLWPFSDIKFDGFSWANFWFLVANYSTVILIYLYFFIKSRKGNNQKQ